MTPTQKAMEAAAQICEAQIKVFLDPRYAANQPASSMAERFACAACAREIRKAAGLPDPHAD
ncbi:MAG: hypothetical protein K2X46_06750 [Roseomonas sp.]|nr:hypothetical protein [Roseomonas sp.]